MLHEWQSLGEAMWPWVRLWPLSGCDTFAMLVTEHLAKLLNKTEEFTGTRGTARIIEETEAECGRKIAAWLRDTHKVRSIEPAKRDDFLSAIQNGEWR